MSKYNLSVDGLNRELVERAAEAANREEISLALWVGAAIAEKLERDGGEVYTYADGRTIPVVRHGVVAPWPGKP